MDPGRGWSWPVVLVDLERYCKLVERAGDLHPALMARQRLSTVHHSGRRARAGGRCRNAFGTGPLMRLAPGRARGNAPSKKTVDRPRFLKDRVTIPHESVSPIDHAAPKFRW